MTRAPTPLPIPPLEALPVPPLESLPSATAPEPPPVRRAPAITGPEPLPIPSFPTPVEVETELDEDDAISLLSIEMEAVSEPMPAASPMVPTRAPAPSPPALRTRAPSPSVVQVSDDEPLDLAALAAQAVQALDAAPPPAPPPPPSVPRRTRPPAPPPLPFSVPRPVPRAGAPAEEDEKVVRTRTIPPDAPLDIIELGSLVPGSSGIDDEVMSEGVIEIPIELEEFEALDELEMMPVLSEAGERALRQTPLLSSLGPDAMQRLITEVELVDLEPGEVLFREGEEGRTLYVVADGAVAVFTEGPPKRRLSSMQEGDFFGETAILTDQGRNATIEADSDRGASLLAIDRNVIGDLVEEEPSVLTALLRFFRNRLVNRLIHTSPLFAPFTGPDSRELIRKFRFLEVPPGALIVEQDKRATGMCVLLAGQMEAVRTDDGVPRNIGTLVHGAICGEVSLLSNEPAPFTVRALSKSFILQLPGSVFREVIMTHPQVLVVVSDLAEERRRRYEAILAGDADYDSSSVTLL